MPLVPFAKNPTTIHFTGLTNAPDDISVFLFIFFWIFFHFLILYFGNILVIG